MPIKKFNSKDGYSINDPPVDLIDNAGNYNTTTGNVTAVNGTFTGDVSAVHFSGDFIGELQVECKNTSGSIIPKGTPVYITGTVGATNVIEVSPSNAGNSATMPAVGLTTEQIEINGTGHVTLIGVVQGMNTNSYIVGQTLYVAVGGGLTNVKPTGATELIQNIGKVGRVNTNNGEIIVTGPGRTNDVPNSISIPGSLTINGDLTVNGTTTNINTTNLVVEDKNIIIGDTTTPTDVTADGGGITLKGTTDKTINWVDATDAWTSSEHFNLLTGKSFYINGSLVLSSNTLGSGITNSSLTTLGTITSGTWNGTAIGATYGGTGQTTYATGDLLYASATNTLSKLSKPGNDGFLRMTNTGVPSYILSTGAGNVVLQSSPEINDPTIYATGMFDTEYTFANLGGASVSVISTGNLSSITSVGTLSSLNVTSPITTSSTTFNLLNTNATTVTAFGAATTLTLGNANNSTINIGNGSGVTLNIGTGSLFGGTKNINIGTNGTFGSSTINIGNGLADVTITGGPGKTISLGGVYSPQIAINGGTITTNSTSVYLFNTTATTVNAFGAATTINMGASNGTTVINGNQVTSLARHWFL